MPLRRTVVVLGLVALAAEAGVARAESAEDKGLAIAREAERRDDGFGDFRADMEMILRDRHGNESVREMRWNSLEVEGDGDKTLIVFDSPRDIKSTALLTHTHTEGADDQWLYLPALGRVKRIAASNKSGPFVGSEFAYEDLTSQEVEKYTYRYLRDEPCGELDCFVVERTPVDDDSGYSRQVAWIDKAEYRFQKIKYFDRRGDLLKTLTIDGYDQYLGRFWRPSEMDMQNHQTGKGTLLLWHRYEFRTGLEGNDFTRTALRRSR